MVRDDIYTTLLILWLHRWKMRAAGHIFFSCKSRGSILSYTRHLHGIVGTICHCELLLFWWLICGVNRSVIFEIYVFEFLMNGFLGWNILKLYLNLPHVVYMIRQSVVNVLFNFVKLVREGVKGLSILDAFPVLWETLSMAIYFEPSMWSRFF